MEAMILLIWKGELWYWILNTVSHPVASWLENGPTQLLCLLLYQQSKEKEIGYKTFWDAERFIF